MRTGMTKSIKERWYAFSRGLRDGDTSHNLSLIYQPLAAALRSEIILQLGLRDVG